ncbi:MAG: hypothetical protein JSS66_11145 [Armatimonadetes bacterium]|nr:hypothetical protein [Armatimonadota bacterium]
MPFLRRNWPVVTLSLLPLLVLWPCVFLGRAIGPWNQILQMQPWGQAPNGSAWDVLQADGVLQFAPWRDLVFDAWGKGQLPLWSPYQLCGTPLLGNSQSAGFYPLHILMGVLHVPTFLAITLLAWFHLAWACLGARALAKALGANETGALIAGSGFGMSAFMVSWTPLASVVTTCSWIPWVLFCATQVLNPNPETRNPKRIAALAVSVGMLLLGGHLQFAAYGFMALLVFGAAYAIQQKARLAKWAGVTLAVFLGVGLAAPQLLPSIAFSRTSHRGQVKPTPEGATAYLASAIGLPELTGLVVPAATGLPGVAATIDGQQVPSYWPAFYKRGAAFAEGAIGLGPLVFGLLFLARRDKLKEQVPVLLTAVVGILLATGSLSLLLYNFVPGWASTGSPGRAGALFVLAMCVWAGTLFSDEETRRTRRLLYGGLSAIVATALMVGLVSTLSKPWLDAAPGPFSFLAATPSAGATLVFLAPFTVIAGAILSGRKSNLRVDKTAVAVIAIVFGSFATGGLCLPTGIPPDFRHEPTATRTAYVNSDWELLARPNALMPGNTPSLYRVHDVAGYDSLLDRDTLEMLRAVDSGKDPAPPANGNMMFVKPDFDPGKLADAGVSEVRCLKPLPQMASSPTQDGNVLVYALSGPGRASINNQPVTISEDGYDRQTVVTTGPGTLIVRDRNMDGWSAKVDGQSAVIKPGLWREVEIGPGEHRIEFKYHAPGLRTGLVAAAASLLLLALLLVSGFVRKSRSNEPASTDSHVK